MISAAAAAFLGFIFWVLAAHLYSPAEIGISGALISAVGLVSSLSLMGLNNSLIRYLPAATRPQDLYRSSLTTSIIASGIIGVVAVILLPSLASKIGFISRSPWLTILFVLVTILFTVNTLLDSIFTALRSAKYVLIRNILLSAVKLALPLLVVSFGAIGLFEAFGAGILVALGFGVAKLANAFKLNFSPAIVSDQLRPILSLSFANYVVSNLGSLPAFVLPILIVNFLGTASAGYYYVAYLIAGMLFVIPSGVASAMLAEGSQSDTNRSKNNLNGLKLMYAILVPSIAAVCIFGPLILAFFGQTYAVQGTALLRVLALSSLFSAFNYAGAVTLNLRHHVVRLVLIHVFEATAVLVSVWLLIGRGLTGVGLGWLLGQMLMSVAYLFLLGIDSKSVAKSFVGYFGRQVTGLGRMFNSGVRSR
jgi:O-antigen/teichoic acid export membrane protein